MAALSDFNGTIDVNMPYSTETEQAVLGSLLVDSSSFDDVSAILSPNYFYNHQNEEIFREMQLLQTSGKPIDFITVLDAVVSAGVFSNKEDAKVYLYSIAESVPALSNTLSYAQIVKDKYVTRSLINACKDVIDSASDTFNTPEQLLDLAEQKIYDIREGKDTSEMSSIMDVSFNVLADLEKLNGPDRNKYLGISTGFSYLDKITTGLNKSDLVILAARPSVGKTSFALNVCSNIVRTRNDIAVAVFSLEMTKEQLAQRIISSLAGVKSQKFRTGEFTDDEMDRITEATSELYSAKLYLDDTSGISVQEIKAKARRIKNLGLIVVDYLQLMSGGNRRSENRVNEISEITRSFKVMAKELNVPIILLSQLSRGTEKEKRRPMLSDLRDSGSIEQDADIVMFLHRESSDEEREAAMQEILLLVAKNRHGEIRNIHLNFEGDITRFTTVEYERDEY
ncbi:MAG: replicative DNA helicase [Oscillospiraceae bacterium]|nr:replicative DNA helicase [Oscillospiraceae bacterium]